MFKPVALSLLVLAWCNTPDNEVQLSGIITKPEVTNYMYGTHALERDGKIRFALKSDAIDLDTYIGKRVQLSGIRVPGYPLSGGPDLIEVRKIKSQ